MHSKILIAGVLATLIGASLPLASISAAETESSPKELDADRAKQIRTGKPSATLDVTAKQLRLLVGGGAGHGVLHFKGKDYPFTVKGGSVGGVGYTQVDATGRVYFLDRLEDFPGTYGSMSAGATLGLGAGKSTFENNKGVVLVLSSKSKGAGLNLGVGAITINLE